MTANKEVLDLANQVANDKIHSDCIDVLIRIENAQKTGGTPKKNKILVRQANAIIAQEVAGWFDCLQYSTDECGNIIPPDIHPRT